MHRPNKDMWTVRDGGEVYHVERIMSPKSPYSEQTSDLWQVDFKGAEKIELASYANAEPHSNLQYFNTRLEFKHRLNVLMGWAGKTGLSAIYGIISVNEDVLHGRKPSDDSVVEAIAEFENILIRNIRVPRKYTPPVAIERNNRKSDHPDYKNVKGSFDLVCRTPGTAKNPYMLEFVLHDCSYDDALGRVKVLEDFAHDLGLRTRVDMFDYAGGQLWAKKTKSKFFQRMLPRRTN